MPGKRAWASANGVEDGAAARPRHLHRNTTGSPGRISKPRLFQYADIIAEEQQREDLKNKLLKAVDRDDLEKYRKSDEEVLRPLSNQKRMQTNVGLVENYPG
jgi:hypothetical protein